MEEKDNILDMEELLEGTKNFYKKNRGDKIWWVDTIGVKGLLEISFDKKTILNLWQDYPEKFSKEQLELFAKENPYWADFFSSRLT